MILPLKVAGYYTYVVPDELRSEVAFGKRVVVQFGLRRFYTAIVAKTHHNAPELVKPKPVLSVADEAPVVTEQQLQLWQWMANYYLCTIGEVMNAALPAALKLDSTTQVELNPDWEEDDTPLSDQEFLITETLRHEGLMSLDDLGKTLEFKRIHYLIQSLVQKNAVLVRETLMERYKPRKASFIGLAPAMENDELLNEVAAGLKRSPKQLELLMLFLHLRDEYPKVPKSLLLENNANASAHLRKLIDKGILVEHKEQVDRLGHQWEQDLKELALDEKQQIALQQVKQQFNQHQVVLLHGVTASGKTHLYMQLLKEVVENGQQALYLLPEIALTAQLVQRLREYFGNAVGIYHSRFNDQERVEIWNKVLTGEYKLVIGARSALFLPFVDLGLVIVDEEHDGSYKQYDPAPRYNARDTAIFLAGINNAKVLLGTATPSMESYFNATTGKYGLVTLTERYGGINLPEIQVVNTREETKKRLMRSHFSSVLLNAIEKALADNEQVILFQNKRGFSPYLVCTNCNWIPRCKNCDVSLTYHKYFDSLRCHYCGYSREVPKTCEQCGQTELRVHGFGTEKIEEEMQVFFPKARIARLDLDTTRGKEAHSLMIDRFSNREVDILVGTQMVTKGLDFGHVSLVGILSADQLLSYPDFRAHERAFQLMEQVSGRAGRRQKIGKVAIQTGDPENTVIVDVLNHNYKAFYENELIARRQYHYPPITRLIQITLRHKDRALVAEAARYMAQELRKGLKGGILMGPTTPIISRVRNLYLQDLLLKLKKEGNEITYHKQLLLHAIEVLKKHDGYKSVDVLLDVDP